MKHKIVIASSLCALSILEYAWGMNEDETTPQVLDQGGDMENTGIQNSHDSDDGPAGSAKGDNDFCKDVGGTDAELIEKLKESLTAMGSGLLGDDFEGEIQELTRLANGLNAEEEKFNETLYQALKGERNAILLTALSPIRSQIPDTDERFSALNEKAADLESMLDGLATSSSIRQDCKQILRASKQLDALYRASFQLSIIEPMLRDTAQQRSQIDLSRKIEATVQLQQSISDMEILSDDETFREQFYPLSSALEALKQHIDTENIAQKALPLFQKLQVEDGKVKVPNPPQEAAPRHAAQFLRKLQLYEFALIETLKKASSQDAWNVLNLIISKLNYMLKNDPDPHFDNQFEALGLRAGVLSKYTMYEKSMKMPREKIVKNIAQHMENIRRLSILDLGEVFDEPTAVLENGGGGSNEQKDGSNENRKKSILTPPRQDEGKQCA